MITHLLRRTNAKWVLMPEGQRVPDGLYLGQCSHIGEEDNYTAKHIIEELRRGADFAIVTIDNYYYGRTSKLNNV